MNDTLEYALLMAVAIGILGALLALFAHSLKDLDQ